LFEALIGDQDLAQQIQPLVEARKKYQVEAEADEDRLKALQDEAERRTKRRRQPRRQSGVLHLVH
jgi:hypothetical protein